MAKSQSKSKGSKGFKLRTVPGQKVSKNGLDLHSLSSNISGFSANKIKFSRPKIAVKPTLKGSVATLSIAFFVIWIVIGLFVGLLMVQGLRRGVFDNLLFGPKAVDDTQAQAQGPTEANLPGIGQVNVSCVRSALSQETIEKLVESQNMSVLSEEEKTKLEPCITQKEEATPSGTPGK